MARQNPIRLSNSDFFKACSCLQNHREQIERDCHTKLAIAVFVKQKTGISVSESTIISLLETTGVKPTLKKRGGAPHSASRRDRLILTRALVRLYKNLGEEVPAELMELHNRAFPNVNGVPVSAVPDPKTIAIANK